MSQWLNCRLQSNLSASFTPCRSHQKGIGTTKTSCSFKGIKYLFVPIFMLMYLLIFENTNCQSQCSLCVEYHYHLSFRSSESYVEEIDFSLLSVHMSSQESNVINGIFNEYHLTFFFISQSIELQDRSLLVILLLEHLKFWNTIIIGIPAKS